jgi:hypothetical protein
MALESDVPPVNNHIFICGKQEYLDELLNLNDYQKIFRRCSYQMMNVYNTPQ